MTTGNCDDLFAAWLYAHESGESPDFDALCAAHPACADELRALHATWKRSAAAIEHLGPPPADDPGLILIPPSAGETEAKVAPLLERLSQRGPPRGRFVVKEKIGMGGMGSVFRVYDSEIGRHVAAKVLHLDDPAYLPRFLEEAQITGQLDHPAFIPVHDFALDEKGRIFFTMKLVKGITDEKTAEVRAETLSDVIEKIHAGIEEWTLTRGLDVILRVAEAMEFAHVKGVVHRDLKPANILVGRYGEVYVTDFGIARVSGKERAPLPASAIPLTLVKTERRDAIERGAAKTPTTESPISPGPTEEGSTIGTAEYMPPEQAEGRLSEIGPRSDIYSLGATLYHLIASVPPWHTLDDHPHRNVIVRKALAGARPAPLHALAPSSPAELLAIVEQAMAVKPKDRYPSMKAFAADLRAYLDRRVVSAYETGAIAELKKWVQRNPALSTAILIGFLALCAFGWWQHERNQIIADERDRVFRLSDMQNLRDIQDRGRLLLDDRGAVFRTYRNHDGIIGQLNSWIADAEELARRLPFHESTLDAIATGSRCNSYDSAPALDSTESAWWHSAVTDLVNGLRSLVENNPSSITIRAMRDRIDEYESIFANSVGAHRSEWEVCLNSIADPSQCPQYRRLEMIPQVGLLPIGKDPKSGLWEFWLVDVTGTEPRRDPSGNLVHTDDCGIVLVLLPGGAFLMGAQKQHPNDPNYDIDTQEDEIPVHNVQLQPFFISKYELTEHQWIMTIRNASWPHGRLNSRSPAGFISWELASSALPRIGLSLPTEAQWEYACRAGTSTPWSTGTVSSSQFGYANLSDNEYQDNLNEQSQVGVLKPNFFGLHDMHGNLFEWCLDHYSGNGDYDQPIDPVTSERRAAMSERRVLRGGSLWAEARFSRSAFRDGQKYSLQQNDFGVRPRRDICTE